MAKLKIPGKHYTKKSMLGISMIVVLSLAVVSIAVAAAVLPGMVAGHEGSEAVMGAYQRPVVEAIVLDNNNQISIDADLSQVFVTVKYSNGTSEKVALSELVVEGLDTSKEGEVSNVTLEFGGFKQTVTYNVVPTTLTVEYVASSGGRIDGETLQNVIAGGDASRVEAIPNEGYRFSGWSDGYTGASRLDKKISKSTKLIATFTRIQYTVIFYYPDGTTAREEKVFYGQKPDRIPNADKESNMKLYGYRFVGWDTDFTHITRDTNIYPIFEKNATDVNVEFTTDREGHALGSIKDLMPYYPKGQEAVLYMSANLSRMFIGWQIKNANGNWIPLNIEGEAINIEVAPDRYVLFRTARISTSNTYTLAFTPPVDDSMYANVNNIEIKADLVFEESEISFTSMSAPVFTPELLTYGAPISDILDVEDMNLLSEKGYNFCGWYDTAHPYNEDGTPALLSNTATFAQDTVLSAYWEKCIYKAVFLKGDNEDMSFMDQSAGYNPDYGGRVLEVYYQDSLSGAVSGAFPEAFPVKENHTFKGWYLADEYRQPTDYVIDRNYKIDDEVVYVYPVFEVNTRKFVAALNGSGNVYSLVYNAQYDTYMEEAVIGEVRMPVTSDYTLRVRPGANYKLTMLKLNGTDILSTLSDDGGYFDVVINSVITEDYYMQAEFSIADYEIAVTNGNRTVSGRVSYNVAGSSETLKQTSSQIDFSFRADNGVSIYLEIFAPDNYYIASVRVGGVLQEIPRGATYYTLVLKSVASDKQVIIVYNETAYAVKLPSDSELSHGSITPAVSVPQYNGGDRPLFLVEAEEGYYIKGVRANGSVIDPYFTSADYIVEDILVNGVEAREGVYDYRVTYMTVTINGIYRDVTFEVDIAPMYYNVNTHANGVGEVTGSLRVAYGENASVFANTVTEYYVAAVTVNGDRMLYGDKSSSAIYSLTSVKCDYEVVFDFERAMHAVTFKSDAGTYDDSAVIVYEDKNYDYGVSGRTFADILKGSNAQFTVKAPEGYYIYEITVKTASDGVSKAETLGFNAMSHTMRIDNVGDDYEITVKFEYILLDYTIYLLGPEGSDPDLNIAGIITPSEDGIAVARGQLIYGNNLAVDINPDSASVALNNIKVVNREGSAYYYEATTAAFAPAQTRGQYALIDSILNINDIRTSVDVYIQLLPTNFGSSRNITINSVGQGTLTATHIGSVTAGTEVTFTATGAGRHSLKSLLVNGSEVETVDGQYTMVVRSDVSVYAIFDETEYNVSIMRVTNGLVNTSATRVVRESSFDIICIPSVGHRLTDFSLNIGNSEYRPSYETDESGIVRYTVPAAWVVDNVVVQATFAPVSYTVTVNYTSGGTSDVASGKSITVYYGTMYNLNLTANAGYFISEISVGGLGIAASSLEGAVINPETNTFVSGTLNAEIVGNTVINVVFAPNVYVVTVAETVGGTTLIKRVSSVNGTTAYENPRAVTFGAGDELWVKAGAQSGYHLKTLLVNGVANTDWYDASVGDNDFSEVYVKVADISGNVTLRVTYAVNEYSINVNASNKSLNFAAYDDTPSSYGTVSIAGYTAGADGIYRGINHGANVRITISPRTARGYYISLFEIIFADGSNTTLNLMGDINPEGGSYVLQNISADIYALNVEFRRRTFRYSADLTVESLGSAYASSGAVSANFVNPYAAGEPVLSENGTYEYGLSYTINVNPGAGYSRTVFEVNGEDRSNAVRSNNFSGIINSDLNINVVYRIEVFTVTYRGNNGGRYYLRTDEGTILWQPGAAILEPGESPAPGVAEYVYSEQVTPNGGVMWINRETGEITVTYNTAFIFVAAPEDYNGYCIKGFKINNIDYTIANGDIENAFNYIVISDTVSEINFEIHEYKIKIKEIEGGMAAATPDIVQWSGRTQITLNLNVGYVLSAVSINGVEDNEAWINLSANGRYTLNGIREDLEVELKVERKPYSVTFGGDYNSLYNITNAANGRTLELEAIAGVDITSGLYDSNPRSFSSARRSDGAGAMISDMNDSGTVIGTDAEGKYIGLRFKDKLVIKLTPPEGYYITAITVSMDVDGSYPQTLISSLAELDADDGSGTRTYTINDVTGNVMVSVSYAIKQYRVTYENREGGRYSDTSDSTRSYYQSLSVTLLANTGYYLKSLTINGQNVGTVVSRDDRTGSIYKYTTDTKDALNNVITLEVNAALVNNRNDIVVTPIFERQYFDVIFYVNGNMVLSGGASQDNVLGLYVENGRIIFNGSTPATIVHTLREGYSIDNIYFSYDSSIDSMTDLPVKSSEGGVNTFDAKSSELKVLLTEDILNYMDFENPNKRTLRIYYYTSRDTHKGVVGNYLISADSGTNKGENVNGEYYTSIGDISGLAFYVNATYSDGKLQNAPHEYGTKATFAATVTPEFNNKYRFEGFQELIGATLIEGELVGGTWRYVRNGEAGITLLSDGLAMEYSMQYTRKFRAVFFRMYKVSVEIHPEFKYFGGSFASNDPAQMMYRQYATLNAEAIYYENDINGVPLPNVAGMREEIVSVDEVPGVYTYYVRSGASIFTRGTDRYVSNNASTGFTYYKVSYDNSGTRIYTQDNTFVNSVQGSNIREDTIVCAYAQNNMYISFLMETIGATVANAGGTMSYSVDGTDVANLRNNSLTMYSGQNLSIVITPASGYRFESVSYLVASPTPDENGFMQFTGRYEKFKTTTDGSVVLSEENKRVTLNLNSWSENTIIKVTFCKQITVTRNIQLVSEGLTLPNFKTSISYDGSRSDDEGTYDYNTPIHFAISENLTANGEWKKYYQFVGFFINGVNNYTQLSQFYPAEPEVTLVLNDLDGLPNGINIIERTDTTNNTTTFNVNIVARFVPVYNIVIENEYVEVGEDNSKTYHNPGSVIASAATYDSDTPQYYSTSYNVSAVTGPEVSTYQAFSMLGEINSIVSGGFDSATSPYNVWNANKLTLQWDSTSVEDSDSYRFISWQYRVYDTVKNAYVYVNIPYVDIDNPTNSVVKSTFTFPINSLHSLCYYMSVGEHGEIAATSKALYNGIPAIVIRPLFQKVVTVTLNKATAVDRPDEFVDNAGTIEPKIGNGDSYGSFSYGSLINLRPATTDGYEFVGWYINYMGVSNIEFGKIIDLPKDPADTRTITNDQVSVTLYGVNVMNAKNAETKLYYNYNEETKNMWIVTDDSYVIVARYTRVYEIILETVNSSGNAAALTASLPVVKYYMETAPDSGVWQLVNGVGSVDENEKRIRLRNIPVGTNIKVMLDPRYTGDVNDVSHFNPRFDSFSRVKISDEHNIDITQNGIDSIFIPDLDFATNDAEYVNELKNLYVIIRANADKTLSISFASRGELIIQNVYWGSGIKLPQTLADIYNDKYNRMQGASFFIYDGGVDDGDGTKNGVIVIKDIPIVRGETYDGKQAGDYANKILGSGHDEKGVLATNIYSYDINFNGSTLGVTKVQTVTYYGGDRPYPFAYIGAESNVGDGTQANPFKITNADHLKNVDALFKGNNGSLSEIYFEVYADIDISSISAPLCAPFYDRKGSYHSEGFDGIFDGKGHTLSKLHLDMAGSSNVGLFALTSHGAVIRNLTLSNFYVVGFDNVGALVGEAMDTIVANVHLKGAGSSYDYISGSRNVGGLIGYAHANDYYNGSDDYSLTNVSAQQYNVSAGTGATYSEAEGFAGGAGGLVGRVGDHIKIVSTSTVDMSDPTISDYITYVDRVNVSSPAGAGGLVGTLVNKNTNGVAVVENVIVKDPNLNSASNERAIGGIVGAIGLNWSVTNACLLVNSNISILSGSALFGSNANFREPNENTIMSFGAGGIAGHNMGTLSNVHVKNKGGNNVITMSGSMVGGIVGVNQGFINNATMGVRIYASRASAGSSYAGGSYGGIVGVNWTGYVSEVSFTIAGTDDYNSETAAIEVITNGNGAYVPQKSGNAGMHEPLVADDPTTVYIGGLVGYNNAGDSQRIGDGMLGGSFSGKIMFNRRSSDATSNNTYIAGGVAYNSVLGVVTGLHITNTYLKLFHYVYVDQSGDDKSETQNAFIGGTYADSAANQSNNDYSNVSASAEYCGGGTRFTAATIEVGLTWTFWAKDYKSGKASVKFRDVSNRSATSVIPIPIEDSNIKKLKEDYPGAVFANDDDIKTIQDASTIGKAAWNYTGYLRYIDVGVA